MKFRNDFVTNSSSSSYIIAFARIADELKAQKILEKFNKSMMSADEIREEKYHGYYGCEWAGAELFTVDDVLQKNLGSEFIMVEESREANYNEDDPFEPIYDYDFKVNALIEEMTEDNGFADLEVDSGAGYNG